jgi:hypothetical protein
MVCLDGRRSAQETDVLCGRFLRWAQRGAGDALDPAGAYLARDTRGLPFGGWPAVSRNEDSQAAMVLVNRPAASRVP